MLSATSARLNATKGKSVSEIVGRHCYKTWSAQKGWKPLNITGAKDCHFWDESGKKYLDVSSQVICSTLGHQNDAVTKALVDQAQKLAFIAPGFAFEARAQLVSRLLEVVPKGIDKFFFPTSGTAANEAAIKIARMYTGKHKIVTRYNSYHGATTLSMSLTSDYRHFVATKMRTIDGNGVLRAPEYHPYRPGPFGVTSDRHMEYFEYLFENEPDIACVIMEPIVGSNGILIPPEDYWPRLRELTKKYGILLIADEVMSGWGRAGEWFAVDKWNVQPDIITTAKGISNSTGPLGMVGTTREIADYFEDHVFSHGHTFESHPMTIAPAVAAIDEYKRLNLMEYSRTAGAKLGEKLSALKAKHPSVGDVRGTGMFWAVDLVKDRKTNAPFATNVSKSRGEPAPVDMVGAKMMEQGVFVLTHVNTINVAPPLIITEEEMDIAVKAIDEALKITDALVVN
ncbi:Aminotransferase class-III, putative [Angomonas deanei]|uniref:Aminotransferase class-III, putative n=1 Tax=Angomonas deanei TaxID=59799 RepID=A0A7G2CRM4_9TRYP|nr:Aminotransferase class-III, putative [Angomonas deanei]